MVHGGKNMQKTLKNDLVEIKLKASASTHLPIGGAFSEKALICWSSAEAGFLLLYVSLITLILVIPVLPILQ